MQYKENDINIRIAPKLIDEKEVSEEEEDTDIDGLFQTFAEKCNEEKNDEICSLLNDMVEIFSNHKIAYDADFDSCEIASILFNLLASKEEEIIHLSLLCINNFINQKNPKYSAELLSKPIETCILKFLEQRVFVSECFNILTSISTVSEMHLINVTEVVGCSFVAQLMEEVAGDVNILDSILDYLCVVLSTEPKKFIDFVLERVAFCLNLDEIPFDGVLRIFTVLLKYDNYDEYQRKYSLCMMLNNNLEHVPEESLPVALVAISSVTEFNFEPNVSFFIQALFNESASIRSAAMYSLTSLIDKNPKTAETMVSDGIVPKLLETPKQSAFEDNEKFALIAKIVVHAPSNIAVDYVHNGVLEILVDAVDSSVYDTIMQGIISLTNSVLLVKGFDDVLELQSEYEVLDIIESSQEKGNEATCEMAKSLLEQLPDETDDDGD